MTVVIALVNQQDVLSLYLSNNVWHYGRHSVSKIPPTPPGTLLAIAISIPTPLARFLN